MATGGDVKPKDTVSTRSATGKGKPVDYKQMLHGNYGEARWTGTEFDSDQSSVETDTGMYQDDVRRPEEDTIMGTSKLREKSPPLPRGDLDFQLAAEEEELTILRRQLEGAKKEEQLLKRRSEADELRRQIEAQHRSNARLRGMPKSDSFQNESKDKKAKSKESIKFDFPNNEDININTLRKSKKLRKLVKQDLKKLSLLDDGSSDSSESSKSGQTELKGTSVSADTQGHKRVKIKKSDPVLPQESADTDVSNSYESSDSSSDTGKKKKNKKKSGIRAKASDTVRFPQKYPQAYLKYEFINSNISFEKLDLNLFIAGELEIISSPKIKEVERSGRINLLKKIMYLSTSYDFKTLKSYYAACLNEIEIGLKTWKDDFQQIESAILSKHIPRSFKKSQFKNKEDTENKKASDEKLWFCGLYNRNKCLQKVSHTERKFGKFHYAHHICATCWQKDAKKLEHPECSSACPYSKM